ncbi:MAG: RecQ family ATP-dependent DNA helicase [Cyanobacteriota bacterium]|nr:RecQ family ATP-dependent DNA helicase [Cyanobacteriota bacterium]
MTIPWDPILKALKTYWGYDHFRPPQDEIVRCLLEKRDALVALPTSSGKSLCFQIPAILTSGITLVISPLIALMEDQVQDLRKRRLAAATLHSQMSGFQRRQVLQAVARHQIRLLYLAPETLFSEAVWPILVDPALPINGLMIDESHTLVHWGESFRPDYRRLGSVRSALGKSFPVAAFTATADAYTQKVLQEVLQLHQPTLIQVSPFRPNLHLHISMAWTPALRKQQTHQFIQRQQGSAGLVYVRTRQEAKDLTAWLRNQGWLTATYHGGLGAEQRRQLEQDWLEDRCPFLVCTNAFGMGINKPNCRWVLHYRPAASISDYVQEVGRGGRDGEVARALMLVSEPSGFLDPTDRQLADFLSQQRQQSQRQARQALKQLPDHGSLAEWLAQAGSEGKLTLALLHQAACLEWRDPFHFRILKRDFPNQRDPLFQDPAEGMRQLIESRHCRWQVIRRAFGDVGGDPCGCCDNCRKQQKR